MTIPAHVDLLRLDLAEVYACEPLAPLAALRAGWMAAAISRLTGENHRTVIEQARKTAARIEQTEAEPAGRRC